MTGRSAGFGKVYVSALETYLLARDEEALSRGYELGREAMRSGLGVLEVANLHQAALSVLAVATTSANQQQTAQAAADFFSELLSPFEMSFRGYRAANEELQRLNDSLRQQKEAVELANRELESFSYTVSHDLRSPLRSINGFSEILLEDFGAVLGNDGRRHLEKVRESARYMGQLIEDLLSLARVTRSAVQHADVDLTAVAHRIAAWLRSASPERDAELVIDEGVRARGDPTLLAVMVENLMSNAWKFTSKRADAKIRFGRDDRDGKPVYFVSDNGVGFDMASAQNLFMPFQRLHTRGEFEGTGIGLATVRRVVQRHDGKVWAESEIGNGATFYFTLGAPP
jgi:light-regulated signal transduction histidine kinase (bacteriophytochrome)